MERRIASLLNSSKFGNIFDKESEGVKGLIEDYFTSSSSSGERFSETDDDESDDENEVTTAMAEETEECEKEDVEDETEAEEPVVRIEGVGENVCTDMQCNGAPAQLLLRAEQFSCNCSQIKFVPREGEARSGCIAQFSPDEIVDINLSIHEMDRESKDVFILGLISSCMRNGPTTECSRRRQQAERQKSRSSYVFMGRSVCTKAFLRLLSISPNKLKALSDHYKENGVVPRVLKSGGRKSNTASLTLRDTERATHFIKQYAEDHAVRLPGRVPGFKRDDIQLLPSSSTKSEVYRRYAQSADRAGFRKIGASSFRKLWLQLCPFIVVAKPMTDLCWRCQNNNIRIFRSANLSLEEKNELLLQQQQHLSQVEAERQLYRDMVANCKATAAQHGLQHLHPSRPNQLDLEMHYSFDFAQQVHYPNNSAQPGPLYFLTPRKCAIFGVCCEGLPQQINYLIDESVNCSKGSNGVVSYLHHFFSAYGLGEKVVHMHCDNCSGQNKNRYVLWYLLWRVMRGLHTEITVNFMPAGHTKLAPDWCFGLVKRRYRRAEVSCLNDICQVVERSTPESHVNIPQLVGKEDGSVIVPTFNWQTYLSPAFKPLKGILGYFHFRFSAEQPGRIFYRASLAEEESHQDLANLPAFQALGELPEVIPAPGLSAERRAYLFNQIREFVREEERDVVCPDPQG